MLGPGLCGRRAGARSGRRARGDRGRAHARDRGRSGDGRFGLASGGAARADERRRSRSCPRARMRDTGYESVGEVLREVPGVLTRRGSESSAAAGEQIQGIDSRGVLVLLDGLPLVGARGIKRGVLNLDRQSVGRLDRVEVVKGASSALYGSDAIGGVINLITRDVRRPFESLFTVAAGSDGRLRRARRGRRSARSRLGVRHGRAPSARRLGPDADDARHDRRGFRPHRRAREGDVSAASRSSSDCARQRLCEPIARPLGGRGGRAER